MSTTRTAVTHVKVELLNVDGSSIGFARIQPSQRALRESLGETVGTGYETTLVLPVSELGDPRCPYRIKVTME